MIILKVPTEQTQIGIHSHKSEVRIKPTTKATESFRVVRYKIPANRGERIKHGNPDRLAPRARAVRSAATIQARSIL